MMLIKVIITVACAVGMAQADNLRAPAADQNETLAYQEGQEGDYTYKYIEVYDWDAKKNKCWEAKQDGNKYYVYANECNLNDKKQDWFYTKEGELKNREYYNYCTHYDFDSSGGTTEDTNLVLEKCNGGYDQKWNYIDYHFSSHYNGYCADLCRSCGGKFGVKKCGKENEDQEHKVEDYWFYGW